MQNNYSFYEWKGAIVSKLVRVLSYTFTCGIQLWASQIQLSHIDL